MKENPDKSTAVKTLVKISPATRRKARHYSMQALYQWHMTQAAPHIIEAEFRTDNDMTHVDTDYLHELIQKIPEQVETLDHSYQPYLQDRALSELDPITKALLRMATYELSFRIDVPYKVVINEAVALGKKFGANESYKFINGVLDRLAPDLRAVEVNAEKNK
ncbi:MAG: N utilization substance protein B [Cellvibrionaceae bacterium]|jgi:N utilization substance protein B